MKQFFLLITLSITVLFGCRKETPVELSSGFIIMQPTCSNGVIDIGEDGVDCGPSCVPCAGSHPIMCSGELSDNKLDASGVITNFISSEVTSTNASGELIFTANQQGSSRIFRVKFATATPDVARTYECVDFANNTDPNKVFVTYSNGSTSKDAYYGKVHLNRENGKYTIEVCDIFMGNPYIMASGRLISSN